MADTSYQSQYSGLEVENAVTQVQGVAKSANSGKYVRISSDGSFTAETVNSGVTGVKGNEESSYRTGQVNLTPGNIGAESLINKVTSISSSSTDTQYPSAKAVYTAVEAGGKVKDVKRNGTTILNASGVANIENSPNIFQQDSEPSSAVAGDMWVDTNDDVDPVSTKEDKTNKVTNINSSSTDAQYPSAKAVYDLLSLAVGKTVQGTLTAGNTSITLSDSSITTSSIIEPYTNIYGVSPTAITVALGSVTLTFKEQSTNVGVMVNIKSGGF